MTNSKKKIKKTAEQKEIERLGGQAQEIQANQPLLIEELMNVVGKLTQSFFDLGVASTSYNALKHIVDTNAGLKAEEKKK